MIAAIAGCGMVGGALKRWLKANTDHELRCQDPKHGCSDDFEGVDVIFIAVPVPTKEDRTQDTTILETLVERYSVLNPTVPIFVRSSVLPGTCDRLQAKYNARVWAMPEFLTERFADEDLSKHPLIVGVPPTYTILPLLREIFPGKHLLTMSNLEAEFAKYAHNCFGAMKVGYFNIIQEACRKVGAEYDRVLAGARMTGFIEETHTRVPGPDGKFGFGGACLPKDLSAFSGFLARHEVTGWTTLMDVERDNFYFRNVKKASQGKAG